MNLKNDLGWIQLIKLTCSEKLDIVGMTQSSHAAVFYAGLCLSGNPTCGVVENAEYRCEQAVSNPEGVN
jgi:hypothetical protein